MDRFDNDDQRQRRAAVRITNGLENHIIDPAVTILTRLSKQRYTVSLHNTKRDLSSTLPQHSGRGLRLLRA